MKILLTGATGLVGKSLLENSNHSFHLLLRKKISTPHPFTLWEDLNPENLPQEDFGIIHLAGESVSPLFWTKALKKRILLSRTKTTEKLFKVIKESGRKPLFFISPSAMAIYGDQAEKEVSEEEEIKSQNLFLQDVCLAWEKEARRFEEFSPVTILRLGMVLSPKKGFLDYQKSFLKKGLLPFPLGNMWLPWISLKDLTSLILWIIETRSSGIYNAVSTPVTLKKFYKELKLGFKGFHLPLPLPLFLIKKLGLESLKNMLLSVKASASKLEKKGFHFKDKSLREVINRSLA